MSEQRGEETRPTCLIITGPNGAGKTTFTLEYLPQVTGCGNLINADLIGVPGEGTPISRVPIAALRHVKPERAGINAAKPPIARLFLSPAEDEIMPPWRAAEQMDLPTPEKPSVEAGGTRSPACRFFHCLALARIGVCDRIVSR